MKDIYFEKNYGQLYEDIEGGECEVFEFQNNIGKVRHMFIKRIIPKKLNNEIFYDLTTPYGYGGPLIIEFEDGKKSELVEAFQNAFKEYCEEQKVISEFIRFHPVFKNAEDFKDYYNLLFKRNTLQTKLSVHADPILNEFSSSCRRDVRLALKAGVEYKLTVAPEDLSKFRKIYHTTMQRNNANSVYYFNDAYFSKCLEYFKENLILIEVIYKGQIIGMSLNFIYKEYMHVHLTGTLQEFHHLAPAYVLQYALVLWGKENGKKLIHLGGGRTGDKDDKLLLFKKKFSKSEELEYFIGHKIWNQKVYDELSREHHESDNKLNFPAYR